MDSGPVGAHFFDFGRGSGIKLYKQLLEDTAAAKEATLAVAAIQLAYGQQHGAVFVSRHYLTGLLTGGGASSQRGLAAAVGKGLGALVDCGIYSLVDERPPGALTLLPVSGALSGYWVHIDDREVPGLVTATGSPAKLLHFYATLLGTITNTKAGSSTLPVGCRTVAQLAALARLSHATVLKYTALLEDLQLIHVYRCHDYYLTRDGTMKGISNTYGRYRDKAAIDAAGIQFRSQYGRGRPLATNVNERRSAAQRYNAWLSGTEYPTNELKQIYETLCQLNLEYVKKNPARVRDLSAFAGFDFYKR